MIRTIYKLIVLNSSSESIHYYALQASLSFIWIGKTINIDKKYLKEYRCPTCNKLLGKGYLNDKDSYLQIKCRGCGNLYMFEGEDREILKVRHKLLKTGDIEDTE